MPGRLPRCLFFFALKASVFFLEKSRDLSVYHVDALCCRHLRKSRHGHDVAGQANHKACACGNVGVSDRDLKALGTSQLCRIVAQGVLGLGHADRKSRIAHIRDLFQFLFRLGSKYDAIRSVDLPGNGLYLFLIAQSLCIVEGRIFGFLFRKGLPDLLCQLSAAFPPFAHTSE